MGFVNDVTDHTESARCRSARDHEHQSLLRSAGLIGFLTLVSRIMGFARDVLSARMFGTSGVWDAFLYAFTVPNFLRRVVGEGALSGAFVPVYTEVLKQKGREEADRVGQIMFTLLGLFLSGLTLLVLAGIQMVMSRFELPAKIEFTLSLLSILFPYIVFLAEVALSMGILNCHRHFLTPSLSPVLLNLMWMGGILFFCPRADTLAGKAHLLAVTVLLSGLIQLAVQIVPLRGLGFRLRMVFDFFHPAIRKIYQLILPAVMGFAVTQVSILIDMTLAFFLGDGANASLWYGNRLMQFPLALIGISMGTVLLPSFSSDAAEKDFEKLNETLSFSLRATSLFVIPACLGLIFLKNPIVRVLFERGEFDAESTVRTANTLMFYSIGLFAYSGQKIMTSAFYAVQDTRTPFLISTFCVGVDIVLNLILMWPLKEGGLALATSLSAILNFLLQVMVLKRRVKEIDVGRIFGSLARIAGASLCMAIAVLWLHAHAPFSLSSAFWDGIFRLSFAIVFGVFSYLLFARLFGVQELGDLARIFGVRR